MEETNWDNAKVHILGQQARHPQGKCVICGEDVHLSGLCEYHYNIHANTLTKKNRQK